MSIEFRHYIRDEGHYYMVDGKEHGPFKDQLAAWAHYVESWTKTDLEENKGVSEDED